MILLSGIKIRDSKRERLRLEIESLKEKQGDKFIPPTLVIFQVGDNKSSGVYIEQKKKFAEYIGAQVLHIKMNEDIDDSVHGIIVQLPLPRHLSVHNITDVIDCKKDVDGLSSQNLGLLVKRNFNIEKDIDKFTESYFKGFIPATAKGVLSILDEYDIDVSGKRVVVLGRSILVGKPIALSLLAKNATVTICHSKTKDLSDITKNADILISAVGVRNLIDENFVSEGQIVIDVGISSYEIINENGESVRKISGDVDFESVSKIISAITPVPGGVGPLTVTSLFENLFESFCNTLI